MRVKDDGVEAIADLWFGPPDEGLRWIDAPSSGDANDEVRWLYPNEGSKQLLARYSIHDAEIADLFDRFARIESSEDAILEFAGTYGPLGIEEPVPGQNVWRQDEPQFRGERLDAWLREKAVMRCAVELVDAVKGRRLAKLRQWLRVRDRHVKFVREDAPTHLWDVGPLPNPLSKHVVAGKLTRAARLVFANISTHYLKRLTWTQPVFDPKSDRLQVRIVTESLLGAMWVQLSQHAVSDRLARCAACGDFMVVERSTRRTCTDACRTALSRNRSTKR